MDNVVDSIPGLNEYHNEANGKINGSQKLGMSLGYFHQRKARKNKTQFVDFIYYTENQYLAKNYRLFMKQAKPVITADEIVNKILNQRIKKKFSKLKLTPFQQFEVEKAKKLKQQKVIKRSSPIQLSIDTSSRSCLTERSAVSSSRNSRNISLKKKKQTVFPNIIQKYKVTSTNSNVLQTIQQTSKSSRNIKLVITNRKF